MPHKLKSSARKSRRNKKIGIVAGIALLVVVIVAAFYIYGQPAVRGLLVEVGGSGSTNATGTQMYDAGALVAIQATADSGWVLSEWLLNDTSVGSANPYVVTMSENRNLTAIFTEAPVQGTRIHQALAAEAVSRGQGGVLEARQGAQGLGPLGHSSHVLDGREAEPPRDLPARRARGGQDGPGVPGRVLPPHMRDGARRAGVMDRKRLYVGCCGRFTCAGRWSSGMTSP